MKRQACVIKYFNNEGPSAAKHDKVIRYGEADLKKFRTPGRVLTIVKERPGFEIRFARHVSLSFSVLSLPSPL